MSLHRNGVIEGQIGERYKGILDSLEENEENDPSSCVHKFVMYVGLKSIILKRL